MFRFENELAFQFFWIIPLVLVIYIWVQKTQLKRLRAGFSSRLLGFLIETVSVRKRHLKFFLQAVCLALMIFSLARPQSGKGEQQLKSEGIELVLMVDVSTSMLAEDVRPNRLHLVKKELERLINKSSGHRIGLIAFAGSAVLMSPVTQDKGALLMYIDSLSPDVVSSQGTAFKEPLVIAEKAFERGGIEAGESSTVTRAVIIVSDGEDNEPGALEQAKKLVEKGIRVFALGVGTEKGAMIPLKNNQGESIGYKKDRSGKPILSRTKGTVLKSLASAGKGSFYHITIGAGVAENILEDLDKLEKSAFESTQYVSYNEHYQWPLAFAILFGLLEILLSEKARPKRVWKGRFAVKEGS